MDIAQISLSSNALPFQNCETAYFAALTLISNGHEMAFLLVLPCRTWGGNFWGPFEAFIVLGSLVSLYPGHATTAARAEVGRPFRLLRPFRIIPFVPGLVDLTKTLVRSVPAMVNIVALLAISTFLYAGATLPSTMMLTRLYSRLMLASTMDIEHACLIPWLICEDVMVKRMPKDPMPNVMKVVDSHKPLTRPLHAAIKMEKEKKIIRTSSPNCLEPCNASCRKHLGLVTQASPMPCEDYALLSLSSCGIGSQGKLSQGCLRATHHVLRNGTRRV